MNTPARRWLPVAGLLAALAVGAAAFSLLRGPATPSTEIGAVTDESGQTAIHALSLSLAEERRARIELAEEVEKLRAALFALTLSAGLEGRRERADLASAERAGEVGIEGTGPDPDAGGEAEGSGDGETEEERPWFDDAVLADLGIDASSIAWLRERWSQHQLERLAINDRAVRDGTLMGPEHREALQKLEADLVAELGTDRYDLMLYATNQPNRVVVTDLIDGSPASRAGLLPGDVIEGYDGTSIFRQSDLVLKIADGAAGQPVRLEVIRGGRPLSIRIPRGPLGVRLKPTSLAPPGR